MPAGRAVKVVAGAEAGVYLGGDVERRSPRAAKDQSPPV